jgi:hypothetical protein
VQEQDRFAVRRAIDRCSKTDAVVIECDIGQRTSPLRSAIKTRRRSQRPICRNLSDRPSR